MLAGMPQRNKALILAHIATVRTQNSEGGNWILEPTRHQFCRKLAEFRASKTRKPRYADIEQYIRQHPFVDQHCISEPPCNDVFKKNNPYTNLADTMERIFLQVGLFLPRKPSRMARQGASKPPMHNIHSQRLKAP